MKLFYGEQKVAEIVTNRSMTVEEALYSHGYDVNSREDCERAYKDNLPGAYMDDDGNYCIDTEQMRMEY